jgi:ABC-type cobalamin/Fe3+-siderophores transport system ATPase subunit
MNADAASTTAEPDEPNAQWLVPHAADGDPYAIDARPGTVTVVIGANGSGKSALGHWLEQHAGAAPVARLIAHRRLWLTSAAPDLTAAGREQFSHSLRSWNRHPDSRWFDHAESQRPGAALFDLLARENERNARLAELVHRGASREEMGSVEASPLRRINAILDRARIDAELRLTKRAALETRTAEDARPYPISRMSDGEKSALLLAAEVLMAPKNAVQIIDEPERHLHRSISAGLIDAVVAERPDCHFIVLTHDLELASLLASDAAHVIVVSRCAWSESGIAEGWELQRVETRSLPDPVRAAILGGRRRVMFVEGHSESLDSRLYTILLPAWDVHAVGGCEQVIRAAAGVDSTSELHWVEARGIVDRDSRDDDESSALAGRGVAVLSVHEIESIYVLPAVIRAVAERQAFEDDPAALAQAATDAALRSLEEHGTPERLAAALARQMVQRQAVTELANASERVAEEEKIAITVPSPYVAELQRFYELLAARDLGRLVARFPVRETALPGRVARALGFTSPERYEAAVRAAVRENAALRRSVIDAAGLSGVAVQGDDNAALTVLSHHHR